MDTALQLLIEHDYCVRIHSVDKGVYVEFPDNINMDYEQITYHYNITEEGILFGNDEDFKHYIVSKDCARLAVLCDIIVKCNFRGINRKLIVAYDKEEKVVADVLGAIWECPKNIAKEERLFHLVSSRHLNDSTKHVAEQEDMLDEYNEIVAIYNRRNGLTV